MNKKLVSSIICSILIVAIAGCGSTSASGQKDLIPGETITGSITENTTEEADSNTAEAVETVMVDAEESANKDVTIETRHVKLTVTNISGIDFGDFSYFEPISGKELLAGDFSNNKAYYYELDWPIVEEEIKWAVYDTDKEMFLQSSSSMENAENEINITFSGDGENLTSVDINYN